MGTQRIETKDAKNSKAFVPEKKAEELVFAVVKEYGLDAQKAKVMELIPKACVYEDKQGKRYCHLQDLQGFVNNLLRAADSGDFSFLMQKRGLTGDRIVDVEEFVESPEYMNQKAYIRPKIKEALMELFAPGNTFVEAVLTGAIGIGKTFFGDMAMAYMLYCLSCYESPQLEYDLAPGSSIIFIQQSISLTLARKVVFDQFGGRLKESPYFMRHFCFDKGIKSELRFPKGITVMPIGGSDTSALGLNVYAAQIEEMNFMSRTTDSIHIKYTREEEYDQAERLYTTLSRRIKSRFMQKGRVPGKILLVSSVNYPGDFTDRKCKEAKTDKTIFVMKYNQWEVLPPDRFSGKKFLVEVGNELKQSRILRDRSEALDEEDVLEVPIEYEPEFERDVDAALRDLAAIATGTRHPFIPFRELIELASDRFTALTGGKQLFRYDSVVIDDVIDRSERNWEDLVDAAYIDQCIFDPLTVFAGHVDVGVTEDAAGVAVGRIIGYTDLPSTRFYSERARGFIEVDDMRAPVYQLDGLLQITSPPSGEVDLELVRDLVLYLRSLLNLKWCTMDSYQSTMMIQSFRRAKIRSGVLSVDTNLGPYMELKLALKDKRILYPDHSVFKRELRELERNENKVDHPSGGSKDVSDACAGVVYILQHKEADLGKAVRRRGGANKRRIADPDDRQDVPREEGTRIVRMTRGGGRKQRPHARIRARIP